MSRFLCAFSLTLAVAAGGCTRGRAPAPPMPLVSATSTMVTAWEIPKNPATDRSLDDSPQAREIRWGYDLFVNTPKEAPELAHGQVSCGNCHLNAGQRERALPLVGVAGIFPEFNRRAGRPYQLTDRIVDCFWRSENGTATPAAIATPTSKEVVALAAYIEWISAGYERGQSPPWRGRNTIAPEHLIPVASLDAQAGEHLFTEKCTSCHGTDGQGVWVGDKRAGPLWGPASWNDGAGASRVYTLAGIIRYSMPYLDPGSLTDEEAQQLAAFITSKPRPVYPFKAKDYQSSPMPPDAVYYRR
ncbi:MAG TPA: c-type cytochrome [Vicinamibacterales bacterium]|nr:c-type cytochrome [Vicinamibacterales bacterium]